MKSFLCHQIRDYEKYLFPSTRRDRVASCMHCRAEYPRKRQPTGWSHGPIPHWYLAWHHRAFQLYHIIVYA